MADLREGDFYYGAILSHCFNQGICPLLIEGKGKKNRRLYDCTTNEGDFKLFAKYRSAPNKSEKEGYNSWQFSFSDKDIAELTQFKDEEGELSLGLVCGKESLCDSEIAFLNKEEIASLLERGKKSVTISHKTGEKNYRVHVGGGRKNAMQVSYNRPH